MLIMPIITLFYQENGLGMKDVLLLQGVYSIAIVALEIPSGYFADIWGRKRTLIIGSIMGVIGFAIYSFTAGFWGFLIAELTLGIGQSFISGSDSALLYDTLKEEGREKEYVKLEGRVLSIGNFAETIAAIIGGFIAEISLRTPFIIQTFIAMIAVPAAFTLVEPYRKLEIKDRWKSTILTLRNTILQNKEMQVLIIFTAFIGTATLTMAWFIQPYLKDILSLTISQIGIALAVLNLIVGLTSLVAYKIENKIGRRNSLILIIIGISSPYIFMGNMQNSFVLIIIALFYFTRGIATPILKDYINRISTSDIRATVLSVRNFAIRIIFAIFGTFLGWYSDFYSIQTALSLAGLIIFTASFISYLFYQHVNNKA